MKEDFKISLAAARVNANLTQQDVAKLLNISNVTVVNWEKGRSEPRLEQALKLAEIYKMPIQNLKVSVEG